MKKSRFGRGNYLKKKYQLTGRYKELDEFSTAIRSWIREKREDLDVEWDELIRDAREFGILEKKRAKTRHAVLA